MPVEFKEFAQLKDKKIMEIMSGALLSAKLKREITVGELYAVEAIRSEPTPGWPIA